MARTEKVYQGFWVVYLADGTVNSYWRRKSNALRRVRLLNTLGK